MVALCHTVSMAMVEDLCSFQPSEVLLKILTRNAVNLRKNNLPTLLNEVTKSKSFTMVIEHTLEELQQKNYESLEHDKTILKGLLAPNDSSDNCVVLIANLTKSLLFEGNDLNPDWFFTITLENPSYQAAMSEFPSFILRHDTTLRGLFEVLKDRAVGFSLDKRWSAFVSPEGNLARNYSLALRDYVETFAEWAPDRETTDSIAFYRNSEVRMIFKRELLKRWDFHMTDGHARAEFHGARDGAFHSFGPAQFTDFSRQIKDPGEENRNEFAFYNRIPLTDIEEIIVVQSGFERVQELLQHFGVTIPISLAREDGEIRVWASLQDLQAASDNSENNKEKIKPIHDLKRDLDATVDLYKEDFESIDPEKQKATYQMVLDAQWSMTRRERDFNNHKETLKLAGNSLETRPFYEMIYNMLFEQQNGKFVEPWMERAAEEVQPCWQTQTCSQRQSHN